jgi:hypothetical protein
MFITEPFDGCHELRDGNAPKAGPWWLFPGVNTVCKQQYFLRRPAFFDILLFPLEARGSKVPIFGRQISIYAKTWEAPAIQGEIVPIKGV